MMFVQRSTKKVSAGILNKRPRRLFEVPAFIWGPAFNWNWTFVLLILIENYL